MIVVAAAMLRREVYQGFLQNVPILATLTEMEVMTLADSLAEETYVDGHMICKQVQFLPPLPPSHPRTTTQ